jgi:ABC-type Fe3+-hydroxamate transport system substrate-binding protein
MISSIGEITSKQLQAKKISDQIKENFAQLQTTNYPDSRSFSEESKLTCYLIWKDPFMTIGGDTFIDDMLRHSGFRNVFEYQKRYPEITIEQLQAANCQLLLLSSEPFPFKQKHIDELQPLLPDTKIILVDGEMFSWYGSRLLKAPSYFQQLQNQVLSLIHARGTE